MFENSDYPKSLDETLFSEWLEKGRESKIPYGYLLIIWEEVDSVYQPTYVENRDELKEYKILENSSSRESLIAIYDLYSESRIDLHFDL